MANRESLDLRRQPSQDRSAQRLDQILDTAAELVDEAGYSAVTPTAVARRAGMSHSGIYRYLADSRAILRALAARNVERFLARTQEILADPDLTWQEGLRGSVRLYAEMLRTEPGFRELRVGNSLDRHLLSETHTNTSLIAVQTVEFFRSRYDLWNRPDLLLSVEALLEIVDALIARAFLNDPNGDEFFIREAERVAVSYLEELVATIPASPWAIYAASSESESRMV